MKKFICVPDSFKGTMSSQKICDIMETSIRSVYPDAAVVKIPVADGGEGSVDAFLSAAGGRKVPARVKGPLLEDVDAFYGTLDDGRTAVVEMAACAGLPLVGDKKDPRAATTYGVGELIAHAVRNGCRKIILCLGGSATNDAGTGAACALGVKFFDAAGKSFVPAGGTLKDICHIDVSGTIPELCETELTAMCDIDNPMYGKTGAAFVFAPQKGASPETAAELDKGLRHLSDVIKAELHTDVSSLPGAGAAGAMGAGMAAFFHARLEKGIETILDAVHFDRLLAGADMVFTGEGRIDAQTLDGKVVAGVAGRAKAFGVPVIAVVGDIGDGISDIYNQGVSAVFSINRVAVPYEKAKKRAESDLALTINNILRLYALGQHTD